MPDTPKRPRSLLTVLRVSTPFETLLDQTPDVTHRRQGLHCRIPQKSRFSSSFCTIAASPGEGSQRSTLMRRNRHLREITLPGLQDVGFPNGDPGIALHDLDAVNPDGALLKQSIGG